MSIGKRGIRDIKTIASVRTGTCANIRHVRQFQLAALELERSVRMKERGAAVDRIRKIDVRLSEIDSLLRKHYDALGLVSQEPDRDRTAAGAEEAVPADAKRRVLRY